MHSDNIPDLVTHLGGWIGEAAPRRLGVAVSGGSDSLALLLGLAQTLDCEATQIFVATVDHGLRSEARDEAAFVAAICTELGLKHTTLRWGQGPKASGNLQAQARDARYSLLSKWAQELGLDAVALGHTADDQAETVLMQLSRAAGVDGLAAMAERSQHVGMTFWRPLLTCRRDALRAYLRAQQQTWVEDPSNEDSRFDRVKLRQAMGGLTELGLGVDALATVAQNMQRAQSALRDQTRLAAAQLIESRYGALRLDRADFSRLPAEIRHRLLVAALRWMGGGRYPPRRRPMDAALAAIGRGEPVTLAGCLILSQKAQIWITPEYRCVAGLTCTQSGKWGRRWQISGPFQDGYRVSALGAAGLKQHPNWRDLQIPRPVLLALPAIWNGSRLVADPLAGEAAKDWFLAAQGKEEFLETLLSH